MTKFVRDPFRQYLNIPIKRDESACSSMRQHALCVRQTTPTENYKFSTRLRVWKRWWAHTTYYTILSNKYVVNDDDDDTHWTGWITHRELSTLRGWEEKREGRHVQSRSREVNAEEKIYEKLRFNRVGRNAWIHRQAFPRVLSMLSLQLWWIVIEWEHEWGICPHACLLDNWFSVKIHSWGWEPVREMICFQCH